MPKEATTHSEFVNNFDLWRLGAALQVAVVHAAEFLGLPGNDKVGHWLGILPGVPIFFFISGFLVTGSWARSKGPKDYVFRRGLRIYPGLWVCLIATTLAVYAFSSIRPPIFALLRWLGAQATFGQFYNPGFFRSYGVGVLNGSLWTVAVELQFYFLLPFIFAYISRNTRWRWPGVIVALVVLGLANRFFYRSHGATDTMALKLLGASFVPFLYFFLLGIVAYVLRDRIIPLAKGRLLLWLGIYLAVFFLLEALHLETRGNAMSPLAAPFLGMLLLAGAYTAPTLADRVLRRNDISYGTYIYHVPVINAFIQLHLTGSWSWALLALAIGLALALASWLLVEHPCIRLKRKTAKSPDSVRLTIADEAPDFGGGVPAPVPE